MRLLVCGGRNFYRESLIFNTLDKIRPDEIVIGGARGADHIAQMWAASRGVDHRVYFARWKTESLSAGPRRNQRMLDAGQPDAVLAFPGGKGTADMIDRASRAGILVETVTEDGIVIPYH